MGADNTFGETNFNPKMSSDPLEEKPFLTEEDLNPKAHQFYKMGYMDAAEKANARISSLESTINRLEKLHADYARNMTRSLIMKQDEVIILQSELKALREERDKFAIEFGDWLNVNFVWRYFHSDNSGYWTLPTRSDEKWTTVQLLEQFKAYTLNTEKQ